MKQQRSMKAHIQRSRCLDSNDGVPSNNFHIFIG